jgi:hypothetical protein
MILKNPPRARLASVVVAALGLTHCGIAVPDIKEAWDADRPADPATGQPAISATAQIEFAIKKRVYCDLKKAVKAVNENSVTNRTADGRVVTTRPLPDSWGAQVSLSLQVDETSALNPGVAFNQVMPNAINAFGPGNTVTTAQSFSLGFGATLSSTATRIDTFNPYWSIAYLMTDNPDSVCLPGHDFFERLHWTPAQSSPFILESDLGIEQWLTGAVLVDTLLHSEGAPSGGGGGHGGGGHGGGGGSGGGGGHGAGGGGGGGGGGQKPDTVTHEIKFVIVSSGTVTPTWKLVKVSANTTGTLFNTGRTRTHDLIITIGPQGTISQQAHFAQQVGNAVANANRSVFMSP